MENNQYQSLLRILYRYQTDTILVYHNGKIRGLVNKSQLEELMSDLSHARSGFELPVIPAEMDQILSTVLKSNVIENGKKVIPVIDNNGRFIALWSKADIVKSVPNKDVSEEDSTNTDRNEPHKNAEPVVHPQIQTSTNVTRGNLEAAQAQLDSAEYISIKTLESLPIPMLAVDTRGEVLFYNQDWVQLQKQNKESLGIKKLMDSARDIMAKMAFDGTLEITSIIDMGVNVRDYSIKMRSILDDSKKRPEVIGYIFWSEKVNTKVVEKEIVKEVVKEVRKESSKEPGADKKNGNDYLGKTLVELLREEEKKILSWAMEEADGNQSNAAMLLGIPRQTFSFRYNKIFSNKMSNKLK